MRYKKGKNSRHLSQLLLGGETRNERSTTFTIYLSCWDERQERKELSPSISVVAGRRDKKWKKHNLHHLSQLLGWDTRKERTLAIYLSCCWEERQEMKEAQPSPSILVAGMRDKKGKNSRHLSQLLLGGETRNERSTTFTIYLSCWDERQERKELSPSISVVAGRRDKKWKKHNLHHLSQLLGWETRKERTLAIYLSCWDARQERKKAQFSLLVVALQHCQSAQGTQL